MTGLRFAFFPPPPSQGDIECPPSPGEVLDSASPGISARISQEEARVCVADWLVTRNLAVLLATRFVKQFDGATWSFRRPG